MKEEKQKAKKAFSVQDLYQAMPEHTKESLRDRVKALPQLKKHYTKRS